MEEVGDAVHYDWAAGGKLGFVIGRITDIRINMCGLLVGFSCGGPSPLAYWAYIC